MTGTNLRVTGSPSQTLTMIGNGTANTIIDGGATTRVLAIDAGAIVSISNLAIVNGNA